MKLSCFLLPFIFLSLLLLGSTTAVSQPIYNMSNLTVDDCKGILLDSENGDLPGTYDHNENYTFSICIPGADRITLTFESFCTEPDFDYMRFYDGPDTLSTQIGGLYTGDVDPPQIVATSGCLTVHFFSDANVTCTGWRARWEVIVPEPVPPNILPINDIDCESTSLSIRFDRDIPCDSIHPGAFSINGPIGVSVISATPAPCTGGFARNVNLVVAPPFSVSGDYDITFTIRETDICQEVHILTATNTFRVINCPLFVSINVADDPLCAGECTTLTARASGGAVGAYSYSWSPVSPNARRIEVCPEFPITYSVTVTDQQGGTAESSIALNPFPAPAIDGGDRLLCQSDDAFFLTATPPGGMWNAAGVSDESMENGWYDPGLVVVPVDSVRYFDQNGCEALAIFSLSPLDQGTDDAACPGSAPFQVSGGLPAGGVWSGANITTNGLFTPPSDTGSFIVTYTHPNGCSGSKTIQVGNIVLPPLDTVCQSDEPFIIPITPYGGVWSGPGITDEDLGQFDPAEANGGDNILHYVINGCEDSLSLFVKPIDALWDFSACPSQAPFVVPGDWGPPGGQWFGAGIVDSLSGLYNPAILGDGFNDTLTYSLDGCTDSRIVYIRYTELDVTRPKKFCTNDDPFELNEETVGAVPRDGNWSGPGVALVGDVWYFRPSFAGPGFHKLIYAANTCIDSMFVEVFATPIITPATFCEEETPQTLQSTLPGGVWSGQGITDETAGIFAPAIAGAGVHDIYYDSPDGCTAEAQISVIPYEDAVIGGLDDFYCFRDTFITPLPSPAGGSFSIDGQPMNRFNPSVLGPGEHTIRYAVGAGACFDEDVRTITIGEPLAVNMSFAEDSICYGFNINISASGSGGDISQAYTYQWNQGLGFGRNHLVSPLTSTTYSVEVSDGCSEPASGNLRVVVYPQIVAGYQTGPKVCYEDSTTATMFVSSEGDFSFAWNTSPVSYGNSIVSHPINYVVTVTNENSGCWIETDVDLPGYPPVTANFGYSPNGDCLSSLDPVIDLLDFSVGGTRGYWTFGDSSSQERYVLGQRLEHTFPDTGQYLITLYLENEGGCRSEHQEWVCVKPEHRLFAPNAITPNYDGSNDYFQFVGLGIEDIRWQVLNRYGQLVFEGAGMEDRWDGTFKGTRVRQGVYTFIARYRSISEAGEKVMKGFITVIY